MATSDIKFVLKVLCIYHARCPDGMAAAWCVRQHYKDQVAAGKVEVEYYPAIHNKPPPWKRISGKDVVYIVDFAYPRLEMQKMAEARNLIVLDHHKSAEAECHGLDFCEFDMNRSGAGMTWDHFFGRETRPWLIDYIEDRDIWKWEFGNSREALAYLDTLPISFETYDQIYEGHITLGGAVEKGEAIVGYIDQYNDQTIEAGLRRISFRDPSGEIHTDIPIVNASYKGISLLANQISLFSKFGIGYFRRNDGMYQFSLRVGGDSGFDVSKLAKLYGGGGHAKAAGFSLDHELEEL